METFFGFLLFAFVGHFVGDFIFQTDAMATGKSKNVSALLDHTLTYTLCLFALGLLGVLFLHIPVHILFIWVPLNFALHTLTDFFTSKLTSGIAAREGMKHNFFLAIGFDQLIHALTLLVTSFILLKGLLT